MKTSKLLFYVTLAILVMGQSAYATSQTSIPVKAASHDSDKTIRVMDFDDQAEAYDVGVTFVGTNSIEEFFGIDAKDANGTKVYDHKSSSEITNLVFKADFSGHNEVDLNGTEVKITGQLFVIYDGIVLQVSSSSATGDSGVALGLPQGTTSVTFLYINHDGTEFHYAMDTVVVRISETGEFPAAIEGTTARVRASIDDNASKPFFGTAPAVDFNATGFGTYEVPVDIAGTFDGNRFIVEGDVDTRGSARFIDTEDEQDFVNDGFSDVPVNILDGDESVEGLYFYVDDFGVHDPETTKELTAFKNADVPKVGVVAFNVVGVTNATGGYTIGNNLDLGGDYSANIGAGIDTFVVDPTKTATGGVPLGFLPFLAAFAAIPIVRRRKD